MLCPTETHSVFPPREQAPSTRSKQLSQPSDTPLAEGDMATVGAVSSVLWAATVVWREEGILQWGDCFLSWPKMLSWAGTCKVVALPEIPEKTVQELLASKDFCWRTLWHAGLLFWCLNAPVMLVQHWLVVQHWLAVRRAKHFSV